MHFCWNCEITDSFAIQVQWYILKPVFWVSCLCFSMLLHCHLYLEWGYPKHEDGSPGSYFCSIKKSVMVCFLPERKGCWPFNHLFLNVAPMIRFVFVFCVRTQRSTPWKSTPRHRNAFGRSSYVSWIGLPWQRREFWDDLGLGHPKS